MEIPTTLPGTDIAAVLEKFDRKSWAMVPVESATRRQIFEGQWRIIDTRPGAWEQAALAGYRINSEHANRWERPRTHVSTTNTLYGNNTQSVEVSVSPDANHTRTYVSAAVREFIEAEIAAVNAQLDREIAARERKASRRPSTPKYGWPTAAYTRQWNKHVKAHESCCYSEGAKGHDHGVLNVA